jgi:hypothetical protein
VHTEQFDAIGWGKVVCVNIHAYKAKPTNEQRQMFFRRPSIEWEKEYSFDALVMAGSYVCWHLKRNRNEDQTNKKLNAKFDTTAYPTIWAYQICRDLEKLVSGKSRKD